MNSVLPEKQRVLKVGISKTSYAQVVDLCRAWAQERRTQAPGTGHYICVTSVHGVMMAEDDPEFARILNDADVATPDGMPVVWAMRSYGARGQQRVYGPTLMLEICRAAAQHGWRIFLYGSYPEVLALLSERLCRQFPGLPIAGMYSPPFRELTAEEKSAVEQQIATSGADIVFVGIGTPKQERWMHQHRPCLAGVTLIGVGAAFDFHAGRTRQAPGWMQHNGLEWLFRLASEPARLWRRYLLITPRFLPLWALQKMRAAVE